MHRQKETEKSPHTNLSTKPYRNLARFIVQMTLLYLTRSAAEIHVGFYPFKKRSL